MKPAMQKHILALALCGSLLASGCHNGLMQKRQSEMNCPTDIRKTVPWCAGEDTIFRCPCGPSSQFYGHKPTCWGHWPTSGSEWRDSYCGYPVGYPSEEVLSEPIPASEPLPESATPHSESGYRRPALRQPVEEGAEPLFVPPQPAAFQQPENRNTTSPGNRVSLGEPTTPTQYLAQSETRPHTEGIQLACHTEETLLESHAWTGVKFVR
jgi:hypothetical protein